MAFADVLMADPFLEAKAVAIELVARYRRALTSGLAAALEAVALEQSVGELGDDRCALWVADRPGAAPEHPGAADRCARGRGTANLWVRRASIVSLIPLARRGEALDLVYEVAATLHPDPHDLIHKAVGWALREAGKPDAARLERYLRQHGPRIPRTTVRYAIERFPASRRSALLAATKQGM